MPQTMKIPDAKAAVDKEWEKLEKLPAWQMTKAKSKREVILEARRDKKESPRCYTDGHLSSQNCRARAEISSIQRTSRARRGIVNDDSGSYAVCTEQGSSASQMTAAKVMDVIARLPGCAGRAADAVSASTQVRKEGAPKLLKILRSKCPEKWKCLPRHKWRRSWSTIEDLLIPLGRNLYGHPLAGLFWARQFEHVLLELGREKKYRIGNARLFNEDIDYSYRYVWLTPKWPDRERTRLPCGRSL